MAPAAAADPVAVGPVVASVTTGPGGRTHPPVVLVPGVGFGPETFVDVHDRLVCRADVGPVAIVHRPGYGLASDRPVVGLDDQAEALAELAGLLGGGTVLVGVSGGATIGLLSVLHHPGAWGAALLHEPLVGRCAPALADLIDARAAELAASPGGLGVERFLASLVGERTWSRLADGQRDAAVARAEIVRREVPWFAAVDVEPAALEALRHGPRLHTSLGACSATPRRQAAGVLANRAGARVHELRSAHHLVQFDAPEALTALVAGIVAERREPSKDVRS